MLDHVKIFQEYAAIEVLNAFIDVLIGNLQTFLIQHLCCIFHDLQALAAGQGNILEGNVDPVLAPCVILAGQVAVSAAVSVQSGVNGEGQNEVCVPVAVVGQLLSSCLGSLEVGCEGQFLVLDLSHNCSGQLGTSNIHTLLIDIVGYFNILCGKDSHSFNGAAGNGQLICLALEAGHSTAGNGGHRLSACGAGSVDHADVTAGDIDLAGSRSGQGGGSSLCPNCAGGAIDGAAGDIQVCSAAAAVGVLLHTVTDRSVGRGQGATLNVGGSIAVPVAAVVHDPSHVGAAQVGEGTVLDGQYATTVVEDGGHGVPATVVGGGELDGTVAGNGHLTVDVEQLVVAGLVVGNSNGISIHIQRYRLAVSDGDGLGVDGNISDQLYSTTGLSSLIEGSLQGGVENAANRSYKSLNGLSGLICMLAADHIGDLLAANSNVLISSAGNIGSSAGDGAGNNAYCVLPVFMLGLQRNILNGVAGSNAGSQLNTCNTAGAAAGCGNSNVLNGVVSQSRIAACIADNAANVGSAHDGRAGRAVNDTILNGQLAVVVVANNSAGTGDALGVNVDFAGNLNILNRAGGCIGKAHNCAHVVAGEVTGVNGYVLDGQVLDLSSAIDRTEQTGADVDIALLCGFSAIEVLNGMALAIKDAVEGCVAIVADIHAPIDGGHINVCAQSYIDTGSIVGGLFCIDAVAECDQIFQILEQEGVSLSAQALEDVAGGLACSLNDRFGFFGCQGCERITGDHTHQHDQAQQSFKTICHFAILPFFFIKMDHSHSELDIFDGCLSRTVILRAPHRSLAENISPQTSGFATEGVPAEIPTLPNRSPRSSKCRHSHVYILTSYIIRTYHTNVKQ